MGRISIDQAADYSASPVGHVGLITSVASGLVALHELRYSASKASQNAVDGQYGATVIGGGPNSFATGSINVGPSKGFYFEDIPANGGLSFAFVVKMKNGGAASDSVVGAFEGSTSTTGFISSEHYNRRVQTQAATYASGSTPPLSGFTQLLAFMDYTAPADGTFRLFIVTAENNVALTLYDPAAATSNAASAVGRDFAFDNPGAFRTCPEVSGPAYAHDVALFAHWSRVITSNERATFYAEMQQQLARYGISV